MRYYWLNIPGGGIGEERQKEVTRLHGNRRVPTEMLEKSWLSYSQGHILRVTSTSILFMAINSYQKQWWLFTRNKEV